MYVSKPVPGLIQVSTQLRGYPAQFLCIKFFNYNAELFCFILPGLKTIPEFWYVETGLIW